jgi:hypothetical protein
MFENNNFIHCTNIWASLSPYFLIPLTGSAIHSLNFFSDFPLPTVELPPRGTVVAALMSVALV